MSPSFNTDKIWLRVELLKKKGLGLKKSVCTIKPMLNIFRYKKHFTCSKNAFSTTLQKNDDDPTRWIGKCKAAMVVEDRLCDGGTRRMWWHESHAWGWPIVCLFASTKMQQYHQQYGRVVTTTASLAFVYGKSICAYIAWLARSITMPTTSLGSGRFFFVHKACQTFFCKSFFFCPSFFFVKAFFCQSL